jgi:hypothetical protein
VSNIPKVYVERLLKFVANELEDSRHIHFYLLWIEALLTEHGPKGNAVLHLPTLLLMQKNMLQKYEDLSKMFVTKLIYLQNYYDTPCVIYYIIYIEVFFVNVQLYNGIFTRSSLFNMVLVNILFNININILFTDAILTNTL